MPAAGPVLLTGMTGGLIALAVTLIVATAAGLVLRRNSGRFRSVQATPLPAMAEVEAVAEVGAMAEAGTMAEVGVAAEVGAAARTTADGADGSGNDVLTAADLGAGLGERATLVQFSTAFCAPCRPTRQILAGVAGMVDGVRHVEIDATNRLDLVRRLRILSTPTILVLGPDGAIGKRATGLPRKADVIAALGQVISTDLSTSSTGLVDNTGNGSGSDSPSETE
jgi:thiol-disulfide isomerase/thioredoxin